MGMINDKVYSWNQEPQKTQADIMAGIWVHSFSYLIGVIRLMVDHRQVGCLHRRA
jgi:hypothetical protein